MAAVTRSVPEWIGKSDDSPVPPRVHDRVFIACGGRCHRCGRKIAAGERHTTEHLKAIINGGENREKNLGLTCDWCLPAKNAEDVAEKSRVYRKRIKHLGIGKTRSRLSDPRYRKTVSGQVIDRETGAPVGRSNS